MNDVQDNNWKIWSKKDYMAKRKRSGAEWEGDEMKN